MVRIVQQSLLNFCNMQLHKLAAYTQGLLVLYFMESAAQGFPQMHFVPNHAHAAESPSVKVATAAYIGGCTDACHERLLSPFHRAFDIQLRSHCSG
jgi:hypothetical protein